MPDNVLPPVVTFAHVLTSVERRHRALAELARALAHLQEAERDEFRQEIELLFDIARVVEAHR